ncbi:hypothetical protein [Magnetococcus sp. PR-3]|uniref:hypothetical protein n=1 Tax=Magnetococcus sp. PR-3 TaxID=3120355 RepID=UPI002FCDE9B2
MNTFRVGLKTALCAALAISTLVPVDGTAGSAVSGFNGKVEVLGGGVDQEGTALVGGAVAMPLNQKFGVQLDVVAGEVSANSLLGGGAHLFWRDSDKGLFGVTAMTASIDSYTRTDFQRFGVEGEYYLPNLTLAATLGTQGGDVDDASYTGLDLRWYAMDDWMLELGGRAADSQTTAHLGMEYRMPLQAMPGLTLFADAATGNNSYQHALFGLRAYFGGGDKPLIQRHRQDDPINMVFDGVSSSFNGIKNNFGCPSGYTNNSGNCTKVNDKF